MLNWRILMLMLSGVLAAIRFKSRKNIISALIAVLIVSAGVGANIAPNIIYRFEHGVNQEVAHRLPYESEVFGLKITQLLLPRSDHRLKILDRLAAKYNQNFPLVNENTLSSLGAVGSIGLLILLCSIFLKKGIKESDDIFNFLALLVLFLVLFATIGGFSALFAVLITPMIRAWNRASVFIGFLSIAASMMVIDQYFKQLKIRFVLPLSMFFAISLVLFGLWDQTAPVCTSCLQDTKKNFVGDADFVHKIEGLMPTGAAIYQLPYIGFPELAPIHHLGTYDLFKGYLHSTHLNWSHGGMLGRQGDLFYRALSKQPVSVQIKVLKRMGFAGIYIDRRGYGDHGAALEAELSNMIGQPPTIISADNNLVFFAISSAADPAVQLPMGLTNNQIMEQAGFVVNQLGVQYPATLHDPLDFRQDGSPSYLESMQGLSAQEPWGRWSDALFSPTIKFVFKEPLPLKFVLLLKVNAFGPNIGRPIQVKIGEQVNSFIPTAQMQEFRLVFNLDKPTKIIEIVPFSPQSIEGNARKIAIGFEKLWIEEN